MRQLREEHSAPIASAIGTLHVALTDPKHGTFMPVRNVLDKRKRLDALNLLLTSLPTMAGAVPWRDLVDDKNAKRLFQCIRSGIVDSVMTEAKSAERTSPKLTMPALENVLHVDTAMRALKSTAEILPILRDINETYGKIVQNVLPGTMLSLTCFQLAEYIVWGRIPGEPQAAEVERHKSITGPIADMTIEAVEKNVAGGELILTSPEFLYITERLIEDLNRMGEWASQSMGDGNEPAPEGACSVGGAVNIKNRLPKTIEHLKYFVTYCRTHCLPGGSAPQPENTAPHMRTAEAAGPSRNTNEKTAEEVPARALNRREIRQLERQCEPQSESRQLELTTASPEPTENEPTAAPPEPTVFLVYEGNNQAASLRRGIASGDTNLVQIGTASVEGRGEVPVYAEDQITEADETAQARELPEVRRSKFIKTATPLLEAWVDRGRKDLIGACRQMNPNTSMIEVNIRKHQSDRNIKDIKALINNINDTLETYNNDSEMVRLREQLSTKLTVLEDLANYGGALNSADSKEVRHLLIKLFEKPQADQWKELVAANEVEFGKIKQLKTETMGEYLYELKLLPKGSTERLKLQSAVLHVHLEKELEEDRDNGGYKPFEPLAAHLKSAEQAGKGRNYELDQITKGNKVARVHRSDVGNDFANALIQAASQPNQSM
jgi:hypothetical protein